MDIHQNVLLETKQRDAQKIKKMQSAVDAKEKEIADTKRSLQKATKESKELSGAMDQKIEAMQTKLSKSNALLETMKRQKEELNSKVRAQQALIEKLKSDSKKVSNDASEKSDKRISEQANTIKDTSHQHKRPQAEGEGDDRGEQAAFSQDEAIKERA